GRPVLLLRLALDRLGRLQPHHQPLHARPLQLRQVRGVRRPLFRVLSDNGAMGLALAVALLSSYVVDRSTTDFLAANSVQRSPGAPWRWLEEEKTPPDEPEGAPKPIFPKSLDPADAAQRSRIFEDFLALPDLYAKPAFGDCVWTSADGAQILAAWLPPDERE